MIQQQIKLLVLCFHLIHLDYLSSIAIQPLAEVIKGYFDTKKASTILYIIIMRRLQENAPPFCFCLNGTDNTFRASDIIRRWNFISDEAKKHNITNFELPVMVIQGQCVIRWNWEQSGIMNYAASINSIAYGQDTVHVATKLRNRLLKTIEPQRHLIFRRA